MFALCSKCDHTLVDEPPFEKDAACENKALDKKWEEDVRKVNEYNSTKCNPLLDAKGAIVTTVKNPAHKEEVLVCNCGENFDFELAIAGGTTYALSCYVSKTETVSE